MRAHSTHTRARAHTFARRPIRACAHIYVRTHTHIRLRDSFIRVFIDQMLTEHLLGVGIGDTIVADQICPDKADRLDRLAGPGVGGWPP